MTKDQKANKARLRRRWREVNDALSDLADLRVWPIGKDITQLEGKLLKKLDVIEYRLGQDLYDQA